MKNEFKTDAVIDNMVNAVCGDAVSYREKHMYRESLRNLVRLAKSEQMSDMKASIERLTGVANAREAKRRAKNVIDAYRLPSGSMPGQEELEFNRD